MEPTIHRFILRYSLKEQIVIMLVTAVSLPFYYFILDLPKTIVNRAIQGKNFPQDFYFWSLDQIPYLITLCFVFLALVFINARFKFYINIMKGRLGERMLRRLRYELYSRILRFPLPHFRKVSQGEIIPMITSEVEALGGFIGDALVLPLHQGGLLLTALFFMFVQDPLLGTFAIALYPLQAYVIPKMQRKVNLLGKERVKVIRKVADRISDTVSGIAEVHVHGTSTYERADFAERMGAIYRIRFDIFQRKFLVKQLNSNIAQLTPFFFYLFGGYLVIAGDLSIGALVAVLAAYKDLAPPWKELLTFYQSQADAVIKYEQVIEQFQPEGMAPAELQEPAPETMPAPSADDRLGIANLAVSDDGGGKLVDGVSFDMGLNEHIAIVGPAGSGKEHLANAIARLVAPSGGRIQLGTDDLLTQPEWRSAQRIAYVGQSSYLFTGTVRENLIYVLKQRPRKAANLDGATAAQRKQWLVEATRAGNSDFDITADWIDYSAAGVADAAELATRCIRMLAVVDLDDDVYQFGLRGTIDPKARPALAARILEARVALRERLKGGEMAALVEPFDEARYNTNATVAENVLFGTQVGPAFDVEKLAENAYVLSVLEKVGLTADLIAMGRKVAETMVELFAGLPPTHEFFAEYSFISSEDLPEFQALLGRTAKIAQAEIRPEDRSRLLSLPFKLIPARHRLGLIDEPMQRRLLEARAAFAANLPANLAKSVEFFRSDSYNAAGTLQDNILFGKVAYGQAQAGARIGKLITEVLATLDLRDAIIEVGIDFSVGVGGSRMSAAQRQKLALARALLRRPQLLICNESTALLDTQAQGKVMDNILRELKGRGVLWVLHRAAFARAFDRIVIMRDGKIVSQGKFADLEGPGAPLHEMLAAE